MKNLFFWKYFFYVKMLHCANWTELNSLLLEVSSWKEKKIIKFFSMHFIAQWSNELQSSILQKKNPYYIKHKCLHPTIATGIQMKIVYTESMAGSMVQDNGMLEYEDGLLIGAKGSKCPAEGLQYTWGSTRYSLHTQNPPGTDWIPICWGLRGCLVSSQALVLISSSRCVLDLV